MEPSLLVLVIADDLTGSCDTGVQFASAGEPSTVLVDVAADPQRLEALLGTQKRSLVIDTESRHLSAYAASEAVSAVARAVRRASSRRRVLTYKKIDSTLRGNVGAETRALSAAFTERVVVVAPAFPDSGRTTEEGRCLVNGVPVDQTEFARDARSPVTSARIADHFPGFSEISHANPDSVATACAGAPAGSLLVVDARTSADLRRIAEAVSSAPERYLVVGSAGLAAALNETVATPGASPDAPTSGALDAPRAAPPAPPHSVQHAVLGIVGSRSERSRAQASRLMQARSVTAVRLDPRSLADAWSAVREALCAGRDVVLLTETTPGGDPNAIADSLGGVARQVLAVEPPRDGGRPVALFLTGGETALAVMRALGSTTIRVYLEIAPGVPAVGIVMDGDSATARTAEIPAVTKAGGFGDDEAMVRAFDCLREGTCWQ